MKRRTNRKPSSVPVGLAVSLAVSLLLTILGTVLITFMIAGESMAPESVGYGSLLTLVLASIAGAVTIVKTVGQKPLVMCLASGGIYFLCLLCMTALFFGGEYQGIPATALAVFGSCTAVALLTLRTTAGPKRKHTKYKIR